MPSDRVKQKVEKDLLRRISHIIQYEVKDPRVQDSFITVAQTVVSSDFRHLKVYVFINADEQRQQEVIEALEKARGFVRKRLGENLDLRVLPDIRFYLDDTPERAHRIEKLLEELPPGERSVAATDPAAAAAGADEEEADGEEDEDEDEADGGEAGEDDEGTAR